MKHLKTFEQQTPKPNLNSVSPEFWKMVEIADWKRVIDGQKSHPKIDDMYRDFTNDAKLRIYSVYSYNEIKNFHLELKIFELIFELWFWPHLFDFHWELNH